MLVVCGADEEALSLIEVEYEELPFVIDPVQAVKPGAPEVLRDPLGHLLGGTVLAGIRDKNQHLHRLHVHSHSTPKGPHRAEGPYGRLSPVRRGSGRRSQLKSPSERRLPGG